MARVDEAKEELDFTRAAYKYRYSVFTPAEVPKKPKKPTALLVGAGSVLAAALLAILLAAASDMATGLVVESWQVRRQLKIEILASSTGPRDDRRFDAATTAMYWLERFGLPYTPSKTIVTRFA